MAAVYSIEMSPEMSPPQGEGGSGIFMGRAGTVCADRGRALCVVLALWDCFVLL